MRNILKRHRVTLASERSSGSWRSFLGHYKDKIVACNFFTAETIHVLILMELVIRGVNLAGYTTNPSTIWVTQQARHLVWDLKDNDRNMMAFLIHNNDEKLTSSLEIVFSSEGFESLYTPYQAPKANAFAEPWMRSAREESLEYILILNEKHLRCVLKEYAECYDHARLNQGIGQRFPVSGSNPKWSTKDPICRRAVLANLIHDYLRQLSSPVSGNGRVITLTTKRVLWLKARPDYELLFSILDRLHLDAEWRYWIRGHGAEVDICDTGEDMEQMAIEVKISLQMSHNTLTSVEEYVQ